MNEFEMLRRDLEWYDRRIDEVDHMIPVSPDAAIRGREYRELLRRARNDIRAELDLLYPEHAKADG